MFEQKINTVSIRVNEESFAVVPFDTHEDAIKAAKQALVALNNGERVELLGKRIDAVERALGDKSTYGIATPLVDGISEWWKNAFAEDEKFRHQHRDAIKALNERVADPKSKEATGRLIPLNCDFVGSLFDVLEHGHLVPDNPFENGGISDTRNRINKPKTTKEEPPKITPLEPVAWGRLNVFGVLNDTTCIKDDAQKWKDAGFKVVELIDPTDTAKTGVKLWEKPERKTETLDLRQSAPLPKPEYPITSGEGVITWGYQDGDLPMTLTTNAETVRDWVWEGKKVFEIQRKPINY